MLTLFFIRELTYSMDISSSSTYMLFLEFWACSSIIFMRCSTACGKLSCVTLPKTLFSFFIICKSLISLQKNGKWWIKKHVLMNSSWIPHEFLMRSSCFPQTFNNYNVICCNSACLYYDLYVSDWYKKRFR